MKKRVVFIMNPISGVASKTGIPMLIDKTLDKDKFDYKLYLTEYAGHASVISTEAKNNGVDIVVAVGGDGTINEVARAIVHSDTALGIIPCGSGNGLARHLLLPMNFKKSIEVINKCEIRDLDYGIINDYPFFCTCGMGFDAFVSKKFAEAGKRGPITYVENILREGLSYQPETYEIEDETGTYRYKAFLISCANASQYGNNAYIAPQASMFNKTLDKSSKIKTFKCKQLHIHRSKEGLIHYDGDPVVTGKDIDIVLKEKGIKIIVNSDADKRTRQPNALQNAAAHLFNEFNSMRDSINKRGQHIQALSRVLQRKLNL